MPELMARVETEDFQRWLVNHRSQSAARAAYGMEDGPIYRDIEDADVAFVQIHTEDLARAREWFLTDEFARATRNAGVVRRQFFTVDP